MTINLSAIGKRAGRTIKAGADTYTGASNGTGDSGRKVGSMLRKGIGKLRGKRTSKSGSGSGSSGSKFMSA